MHIAFTDDARCVDKDFTLDLPVPVHFSVNLNTTAQIPDGGDFVTILKNDAGSLKHVFQRKAGRRVKKTGKLFLVVTRFRIDSLTRVKDLTSRICFVNP